VGGIASGRAAGMKVLGVTNSYPAEKLRGAHRVVGSLADVSPADLRGLFPA
jgi:beta-phosphoglucomutase